MVGHGVLELWAPLASGARVLSPVTAKAWALRKGHLLNSKLNVVAAL